MSEPSLPELEGERDRLFAQLVALGDFRRGSVHPSPGRMQVIACEAVAFQAGRAGSIPVIRSL
jgi:hypothetical protein